MQTGLSIFFDDNAIILTDKSPSDQNQSVFVRSSSDVRRFLDRFIASNLQNDIYLVGLDLNSLFEDFKAYFKYVEAAGGVVKNTKGETLLINRFAIWDLPKGKLEKDEEPLQGAMREVEEETGVEKLSLVDRLPSTYHIYPHKEKYILKKTHWFSMDTNYNGLLTPELSEEITDAVWMSREEAILALKASYRSIREVLMPCI